MSVKDLEIKLEVKRVRGWSAVYAGKSKLSVGFRNHESALSELEKNRSLYEYWSGSAGVCSENLEPVIVNV